MNEVAIMRGAVNTGQFNVRIPLDLELRIKRLKTERRIDTSEEARKALTEMVERLERLERATA